MNQTTTPVFRSAAQEQQVLADIEAALRTDTNLAVELAGQALADGFEHPQTLMLVAYQFEQEGRYPEALRLLDRAAGLSPQDPYVWNSVGLCLGKQYQRSESIAAFDHALALDPYFVQAHFNLAVALEQFGGFEEARDHFRQAVEFAPDFADPLGGLASLAVKEGDYAAARELAARALALDPTQAAAITANAQVDLSEKKFESAELALRILKDAPGLDSYDKPTVHCLLGDALDGLDRPDDAFAEYLAGKTGSRSAFAHRFETPETESQLEMVQRLTRYFDAASPEAWSKPAEQAPGEPWPARRHAFLLGFPRSGTTLLEQVLASHADMVAVDERSTLKDIDRLYLPSAETLDQLADLQPVEAAERRAVYWARVRRFNIDPVDKIVVDKMPLYTTKLPVISKLFPGVKVLFALRDPRDVVLSCFRRSFQMNAGMYQFVTLEGTARYYDAVMTLAELYRRKLPLDLHVVQYEKLVVDFEAETRAVCEFLGAEWSAAMVEFAEKSRGRQIRTPSAAQVRRGLYTTGADQWRRYAKHLEPVMPILQPWIERFGYEPG